MQQANAGQQNSNLPPFSQSTRLQRQAIAPILFTANARVPVVVPPVGYLKSIRLYVTVNFTTGATGTYTNGIYSPFTPYDIIQNVTLDANASTILFNISGGMLYLRNRILAMNYDPRNPASSFNSTNTAADIFSIPTTYTTSTSYTHTFMLELDVAWMNQAAKGLIPLQNDTNRVTLAVTFGSSTNLLTQGGTTPSITINSAQVIPVIEFFAVPANPNIKPDLTSAHIVLEDQQAIVGPGNQTYQMPSSNTMVSFMQYFINNNAPISPLNMLTSQVRYALSQYPYSVPVQEVVAMNRRMLGNMDLPDGVLFYPWDEPQGLREILGTRDSFDTNAQTDFAVITGLSSALTITQPALSRNVRDMLAPASFNS